MNLDFLKRFLTKVKFWHVIVLIVIASGIYFGYEIFVGQPTASRNTATLQKIIAQEGLKQCLTGAATTYSTNWASSCKSGYQACITDGFSTQDECSQTWNPSPTQDPWSCGLTNYQSTRWDDQLQQDKQNCFTEYPQS